MNQQLTDDELSAFIPDRLLTEWRASRTHPNCKWDADAVVDFFRELALSRAENARLQDGYDGLKFQYDEEHDELLGYKALAERRGEALEPFMFCQDVQHKPAEYVTREMAIDAGEPTMEGTLLRGELSEPCLACDGCHARAALAATSEEESPSRDG